MFPGIKKNKKGPGILQPGDSFEKYTVEKLLGKGGMGAVYLVRHNILDSLFALKVLFPEVAARNGKFVDRFIREAKLACKIRHPNLITVHDAGKNPDNGMYYLVMDYVPGGSVRELLKKNGRLSPGRAIAIVGQVASALEAAGQHHMVHRDIKPDNIMFAADGSVKLADLGIAKSTNEEDTMLTMDAAVFGTPAYMSPEQALDSRNVDHRADIYSLGIVLFEMISGKCPYRGQGTIEILSQVIKDEDIPDIRTICPAVPESVASLIADMTEKKLQNRIPSPAAILARIHELPPLPDGPVSPSPGIPQVPTEYTAVTLPTLIRSEHPAAETGELSPEAGPSPEETMPTMITPPDNPPLNTVTQADAGCPAPPAENTLLQTITGKSPERRRKIFFRGIGALCLALVLGGILILALPKGQSGTERTTAGPSEKKITVPVISAPLRTDDRMESDELVRDAVVILSGATETAQKIRTDLKKHCQKPIVFLETESLYCRQLKNIIRHKPFFMILIPSAYWIGSGRSRATFETMLREEINLLRDNQISFAFVLDPEDPEHPETAGFNQAVKELCSLKSLDCFEADSSDWQEKFRLP